MDTQSFMGTSNLPQFYILTAVLLTLPIPTLTNMAMDLKIQTCIHAQLSNVEQVKARSSKETTTLLS